MTQDVRRGYVDVGHGQVHYAEAGAGGTPLLLLHQTPRSWDEFRELIPLLAVDRRVVAMDLPGMGASDPWPGGRSIEGYADAAAALLTALSIDSADVMGHHTGSIVAMDLAARHPELVARLVLSSPEWIDAAARSKAQAEPKVDFAPVADDGQHMTDLWRFRQGFYPEGRTDLLVRYIRDALVSRDPVEGHDACAEYRMEDTIDSIVAPVLLLGHDDDEFAYPAIPKVEPRLRDVRTVVIRGGMVPLEVETEQVADAVRRFLDAEGGEDA